MPCLPGGRKALANTLEAVPEESVGILMEKHLLGYSYILSFYYVFN